MLKGIWGKKIGMTQVFSQENAVVPVTVVDFNGWYVTAINTQEKHGYNAIQVSCVRDRYQKEAFSGEWLKDKKKYFTVSREIKVDSHAEAAYEVGKPLDVDTILQAGQLVDVFGITKGRGFQGGVKRHGFTGGRASHGPRFGRIPGSVSFMRSQGKVIKGKRLPGHMGVDRRVMKKLEVVQVLGQEKVALIKGSMPGGTSGLLFMLKA